MSEEIGILRGENQFPERAVVDRFNGRESAARIYISRGVDVNMRGGSVVRANQSLEVGNILVRYINEKLLSTGFIRVLSQKTRPPNTLS